MNSKEIQFKNGHLWINPNPDDFPDFGYWNVFETPQILVDARHIRLQIMIQKSKVAHWGILGATLYSGDEPIRIEFPESTRDTFLGEGYPQSLIALANQKISATNISTGRLAFDYRTYSNTDSSPFIFMVLASCLTQFFDMPQGSLNPETIQQIIQETIQHW